MSTTRLYDPQIRVLDCTGLFMFELTPAEARPYIDAGAREVGNRKRVHSIVLTEAQVKTLRQDESARTGGNVPAGQKFSHNRETPINPHGVWMFHDRSLIPFSALAQSDAAPTT